MEIHSFLPEIWISKIQNTGFFFQFLKKNTFFFLEMF